MHTQVVQVTQASIDLPAVSVAFMQLYWSYTHQTTQSQDFGVPRLAGLPVACLHMHNEPDHSKPDSYGPRQ